MKLQNKDAEGAEVAGEERLQASPLPMNSAALTRGKCLAACTRAGAQGTRQNARTQRCKDAVAGGEVLLPSEISFLLPCQVRNASRCTVLVRIPQENTPAAFFAGASKIETQRAFLRDPGQDRGPKAAPGRAAETIFPRQISSSTHCVLASLRLCVALLSAQNTALSPEG